MSDKTGAQLIAAERQRQIEFEGWTPEHDDDYKSGQLSMAAACYAFHTSAGISTESGAVEWSREDIYGIREVQRIVRTAWPWHRQWWKPDTRIRNLVKAGALIAAEIDRLKRIA